MARQIRRIILMVHQNLFCLQTLPVSAYGKHGTGSSACMDEIMFSRFLHISRIIQVHFFILNKCGTGISSMAVLRLIRHQRNPLKGPVKQIPAGTVSPELQPSLCAKRAELIKSMVNAPVLAKAVGIVQPPGRRCNVELRAPSFFLKTFQSLLYKLLPYLMQCIHKTSYLHSKLLCDDTKSITPPQAAEAV